MAHSAQALEVRFLTRINDWLFLYKKEKKVAEKDPVRFLVGFSGGVDSVALVSLLLAVQKKVPGLFEIVLAHLNHGWRQTALDDEQFCRKFAAESGLKLEVGQGASLVIDEKRAAGSLEYAGRLKRRAFFSWCQQKYHAPVVVLAHHADDQRETFFIRLARGSSLEGLSCMRLWKEPYFRPLLVFAKHELFDYCHEKKLLYCHDESNDSDDYLRNRVRKYLMPQLSKIDERIEANLLKTIGQLRDDSELLEFFVEERFAALFFYESGKLYGSKALFFAQPERLQQHLILRWLIHEKVSFTLSLGLIQEILRFLKNNAGGSHTLSNRWRIRKKQQLFWLESSLV